MTGEEHQALHFYDAERRVRIAADLIYVDAYLDDAGRAIGPIFVGRRKTACGTYHLVPETLLGTLGKD